jgi:hypothetical protein
MNDMERTIKQNLLKHHAGHTMFCPACNTILDCRDAVEIDFLVEGKLQASRIACASCFDKLIKPDIDTYATKLRAGHAVEITDGRELWPRRKKAKAN